MVDIHTAIVTGTCLQHTALVNVVICYISMSWPHNVHHIMKVYDFNIKHYFDFLKGLKSISLTTESF